MRAYSLSHLSDRDLLQGLSSLVVRDRSTTAELVAHIAEVDSRRLFVPAGYPSMYLYCVQELRLSEDSALKRIRAARMAREFPAIFGALADGRLSLSTVVLLKAHINQANADGLLMAATGKSPSEVELMLAQRFPQSESLPMIEAVPVSVTVSEPERELAPGPVGEQEAVKIQLAPGPVEGSAATVTASFNQKTPTHVPTPPRTKIAPIAPQRFELHVSIGQGLHDKLRHAQELLSHQLPSGDIPAVLEQALDALITKLEKAKLAATSRPQKKPRPTKTARHVPAHVRRAVRARDGGQCTYVSEAGKRCSCRKFLELDHIIPVARGGKATVDNLRLRCRTHNQFEAERAFGRVFMEHKRQEAKRASIQARSRENPAADPPAVTSGGSCAATGPGAS